MSTRQREIQRLARLYVEYLNGPLGKGVLDRLQEGESFTIRTQDDIMQFTKDHGKAVVRIMQNPLDTEESQIEAK